MKFASFNLLIGACLFFGADIFGAAPQLLNYQALLKGPSGNPLDTTVNVAFTIYNHPTLNNILWTESHLSMTVADGNLSVLLGSVATLPDSLFKGTESYLGIKVGADPEISPRNRLASVPYAFRLETIDGARAGNMSGTLVISPDTAKAIGEALLVKNQNGEVVFSVKVGALGSAEVSVFDPVDSKDGSRAVEPTFIISGSGNITGRGQISMGTDSVAGTWSTVFGYNNSATGDSATVSGGFNNSAAGFTSVVAGGNNNNCANYNSVISGGTGNYNAGNGSCISGGGQNTIIDGTFNVVGGGGLNFVQNDIVYGTIGGGYGHGLGGDGRYSTIGGGGENAVSDTAGTIAGGFQNRSGTPFSPGWGHFSTVGGGKFNHAGFFGIAPYSTIAGGNSNYAGVSNDASYSTIGGGDSNTVDGIWATIPGGRQNEATGNYSFAAGRQAKSIHTGSFVWSDSITDNFSSSAANQFNVRSSGGYRLFSDSGLNSGVTMGAGASSWTSVSDKNVKKDFREINSDELLKKLSEIPISRWKYIAEKSQADHIGPMSQDFYSAFGLGDDDKRISTIDADGVALAAIQALHKQNQELKKELDELRQQVIELSRK